MSMQWSDVGLFVSVLSIFAAYVFFHYQLIKSKQLACLNEIIRRTELINSLAIKSFDPFCGNLYAEFSFHRSILKRNIERFFECHTWRHWLDRKTGYKDVLVRYDDWLEYIEFNTNIETSDDRSVSQKEAVKNIYIKSGELISKLWELY